MIRTMLALALLAVPWTVAAAETTPPDFRPACPSVTLGEAYDRSAFEARSGASYDAERRYSPEQLHGETLRRLGPIAAARPERMVQFTVAEGDRVRYLMFLALRQDRIVAVYCHAYARP